MTLLTNARKNPKVSAKCSLITEALLLNMNPSAEQRIAVTELLYCLWNIDGIWLDDDQIKFLHEQVVIAPYDRKNVAFDVYKEQVADSDKNGSGYMRQLLNYLKNI